jgi:hypothetical protein
MSSFDVTSFLNEIHDLSEEQLDQKLQQLTPEELNVLHKKSSPYEYVVPHAESKYACLSYTNLQEDYIEKLTTVGFIGYLYRSAKEYKVDDCDLYSMDGEVLKSEDDFTEVHEHPDSCNNEVTTSVYNSIYNKVKLEYLSKKPEDYKLSIAEELSISRDARIQYDEHYKPKKVLNKITYSEYLDKCIKKQSEFEKKIINRFLDSLFQYNPDLHISGSKSSKEQKKMKPLLDDIIINPPSELFYNYNNYKKFYYEQIKDIVENKYKCHNDVEIAFNVFETFDKEEDARFFIEKNQKHFITDIRLIKTNKWIFTGPFEKNNNIKLYSDNAGPLLEILQRLDEDKETIQELTKNRVKKVKKTNVRRMGLDDPEFTKYSTLNPSQIASEINAINVDIKEDEETKELEITETYEFGTDGQPVDSNGVPQNAIYSDVYHIDGNTQEMKTSRVFMQAEKPNNNI